MHFIMVCTAEPFSTLGLLPITVRQMISIFRLSMKFGQRSILDCASRLKSQTKRALFLDGFNAKMTLSTFQYP